MGRAARPQITLITPEPAPLAVFGRAATAAIRAELSSPASASTAARTRTWRRGTPRPSSCIPGCGGSTSTASSRCRAPRPPAGGRPRGRDGVPGGRRPRQGARTAPRVGRGGRHRVPGQVWGSGRGTGRRGGGGDRRVGRRRRRAAAVPARAARTAPDGHERAVHAPRRRRRRRRRRRVAPAALVAAGQGRRSVDRALPRRPRPHGPGRPPRRRTAGSRCRPTSARSSRAPRPADRGPARPRQRRRYTGGRSQTVPTWSRKPRRSGRPGSASSTSPPRRGSSAASTGTLRCS